MAIEPSASLPRCGAPFPPVGLVLVPVVAVLVFPQQTIVRAGIALEVGVVGPGAMYHDAFGSNLALGKNELVQILCYPLALQPARRTFRLLQAAFPLCPICIVVLHKS